MFFKTKPNLPDVEKARIEFHLQQIAEKIGFDRFKLPVVSRDSFHALLDSNKTPQQIFDFIGKHLGHETSEMQLVVAPQQRANCSGGG